MMSSGTSALATNAKFTKLPDCTSPQLFCRGWTLSQSPYQYYGYALIWQLPLHCPGLVRSDCVSRMVYAAIRERICDCVFYF